MVFFYTYIDNLNHKSGRKSEDFQDFLIKNYKLSPYLNNIL